MRQPKSIIFSVTYIFLVLFITSDANAKIKNCINITEEDRFTIGFQCQTRCQKGVFERVEYKNFGVAWKDPNGVIWSGAAQTEYDNSDIEDAWNENRWKDWDEYASNATNYCKSIGGLLPLPADYSNLIYWFKDEVFGHFVDKREVIKIFPAMKNKRFWTSAVFHDVSLGAIFSLDAENGGIEQNSADTAEKHAIRCILDRPHD